MFTIYPFENSLYLMRLSGEEIRNYLEYSYDKWIVTYKPGGHVFNMTDRDDARYFQSRWSFNYPSYNFDSASGLNYTVDITKPFGSRVVISSMADGSKFDPKSFYKVAMTSYRAAGGGDLIFKGAGLTRDQLEERTLARFPEIRDLIYRYFEEHGEVKAGSFEGMGDWKFVPEKTAKKAIYEDMTLLFGD